MFYELIVILVTMNIVQPLVVYDYSNESYSARSTVELMQVKLDYLMKMWLF